MAENIILKERRDLKIIGYDKPIVIFDKDGLKLFSIFENNKYQIRLFLDNEPVMSNRLTEHLSMQKAVGECPENARTFIGGLGFGLILLYLAEAKKAKEVIVCEIDQRVLDVFSLPITNYLKENYPDFNFKIIKGDAYEEIIKNGLFDWIYMDLSKMPDLEIEKLSIPFLTKNGRYSSFQEVII